MRQRLRPITALAATACAAAVLVGLAPAASAASLDYAALGDSQASGLGAGSNISSSGDCKRSNNSYAARYAAEKKVQSFVFTACSGATTGSIAGQAARLNSGTDLVTVQVGGNDAGFSEVMLTCKTGSDSQCGAALDAASHKINGLGGKLDQAYRAIRAKAPKARVVVVGYPRLFEVGACANEMSEYKRSRLNSAADLLDNVTQGRASAAGFTFLDVRGTFAGHGVCSGSPWINGLRSPLEESYHPNQAGHRDGFYRALRNVAG